MHRPGIHNGPHCCMGCGHQTKQPFKRVNKLMRFAFSGFGLWHNRKPQHDFVQSEHVAQRVEPLAVQFEKILERMLL